MGAGPNLTSFTFGQYVGAQTTTMATANIPAHSHDGQAWLNIPVGTDMDTDTPGPGTYIGPVTDGFSIDGGDYIYMQKVSVSNTAIGNTAGLPIPIMPAFQVLNYIICVYGPFPIRPQAIN